MQCAAIKVLVVEEDPCDATWAKIGFDKARTRFETVRVNSAADALQCLTTESFDVAVIDLTLPDSRAWEGVLALRQGALSLPIVLLTSGACDDAALAALGVDAQDNLFRDDVTPISLELTIHGAIARQKNAELGRQLNQAEADQRKLARRHKRLTRRYRASHRFVDHAAHDFRTPLTVIMEYVSILREGLAGELDAQQRRMLDVCADRADDLKNMVNDMLDVSKLSAGILGISRTACRIEDVIKNVQGNLQRKGAISGIAIETAVEEDLPDVYCDPEKIGRVLINLAGNAIKFSGRSAKVRIAAAVDPLSPQVVVSVSDNGPGIDEPRLGELFKRFKHFGAPQRRSAGEVGLGLSIAKELVQLNFGEIRIDSQLGKGSTFSFSVPQCDPLEVTRRYLRQPRVASRKLSLVEVVVGRIEEPCSGEDVHAFLNCLVRKHDVMFRTGTHRWLILLSASTAETDHFLARVRQTRLDTNCNRPYGALPEICLTRLGAWSMKNQHEDVVDSLSRALSAEVRARKVTNETVGAH